MATTHSVAVPQVAARGFAGAALGLAELTLRLGATLAVQVLLVRVLSAGEFGQFAWTLIALDSCLALSHLRLGSYWVQHRDPATRRGLLDGVFLQLTASTAMFGLAQLALYVFGSKADTDQLAAVRWMLLAVWLTPLSSMLRAPLDREQRYLRATLPSLVALPVQAAVALGLAAAGHGVMALVYGHLAREACQLAALAALCPAALRSGRQRLRRGAALRFAGPLLLSGGLVFFYWNLDDALVGALLGSDALGHYFVAFRFPHLLMALTGPLIGVSLSVFARLQSSPDELARAFETCTRLTGYLCLVGGAAGATLVVPLTRVVLGSEWLPAASAMQILFLLAAIRGPLGFWTSLYESRGITDHHYRMPALSGLLVLLAAPPCIAAYGLPGAASAVALSMAPSLLFFVPRYVRRLLPRTSVHACLRYPALLAAANALALGAWVRQSPPNDAAQLGVLLALTFAANAGCVLALEYRPLNRLLCDMRCP